MYKLLALDLDGTLLNSDSEISEGNKEAIKDALNRNIKIIICSGRIFKGARIFARQVDLKDPLIACNGALIKKTDTEKVLYDNPLSLEDSLKIVDICHEKDLYFHAYAGNVMYTERFDFNMSFYWNLNQKLQPRDRVDISIVGDFSEMLCKNQMRVSKFVVVSNDEGILSRARDKVAAINTVEVMSSKRGNFEVVNFGVNKGKALKYISDLLGIKREEIIAIGDNENDHSMIRFAGLGVAMGNAEEKIKEIADYITSSNDQDGVAEVIKRFIL